MKDPFWSSKVVRGLVIAAIGVLSMGAASIVRQQSDDIAELKTGAAVKAAEYQHILNDLRAIKTHLGIPQ